MNLAKIGGAPPGYGLGVVSYHSDQSDVKKYECTYRKEMGNMSKRQQQHHENYTTECHPGVFNEQRGKDTPEDNYTIYNCLNWPLITNTRAGEIDMNTG